MKLPQYTSEIQGLTETIRAIEEFAPDLKRELDKEAKAVLSSIVNEARDYIPFDIHPSGWARQNKYANLIGPLPQGKTRVGFKPFDSAKAKLGIKSSAPTSKKSKDGRLTTSFKNSYSVVQRDAAGAIFETAGRGSGASRARTRASRSTNPYASQQFIQTVEKYYGVIPTARHDGNDKGRALIKAVDNNRKMAQAKIFKAIESARDKTQARLDSIKGEG